MKLQERLDSFAPILLRLLARHKHGPPLSVQEIACASGRLNPLQVGLLAECTDWEGVGLLDALAFMRGCGLDLDNAPAWRRVEDYLRKRPTFHYLRASPDWEAYYKPLLRRWISSCGRAAPDTLRPPVRSLIDRLAIK